MELDKCNDDEEELNIYIDFTADKCECGNMIYYSEKTCSKCGRLNNNYENKEDPVVILRRNVFKSITECIRKNSEDIKILKHDINGKKNSISLIDFISIMEPNFVVLEQSINNNNIYTNVSFESKNLKGEVVKKQIEIIKVNIDNLYNIYKTLIIIEPTYLWKNIYDRTISMVAKILKFNKLIVSAIIASNLNDAKKIISEVQKQLDSATDDLTIINEIISLETIQNEYNIVEDGTVNIPLYMLNLCEVGNKSVNIKDKYTQLQLTGYNYFKKFLYNEFDQYANLQNSFLLNLSSYRFMSIICFSEKCYIQKVKIVLDSLEKAKKINFLQLKIFIDKYNGKYINAIKLIFQEFEDIMMILSYSKNEEQVVRHMIKFYKDFSEGIYRDLVSILIACGSIIDKKEIEDYEKILIWDSFADKTSYMKNKSKLNFDKLTDGVDQFIRNAEAHVDFEVDIVNERVILRNKNKKTKEIVEKSYKYDEFSTIQMKLIETITAILTGLQIFMNNNHNDFRNILSNYEQVIAIHNKANEWKCMFALYGIIDMKKTEFIEDNINQLLITGTSLYRTDKDVLNSCINCIVPYIKDEDEIDVVCIKLSDNDSIPIGEVKLLNKYVRDSFKVKENLKKYNYLLILKTTLFNYIEETQEEDFFGFNFVYVIIKFLLDLINDYMTNRALFSNRVKEELSYMDYTLKEYLPYIQNNKLVLYVIGLVDKYKQSINIVEEGIKYNDLKRCTRGDYIRKNICLKLSDILDTKAEKEKIQKFLFRESDWSNIGRNDLCPCGSGKKFKNCCLKLMK